ncbi:MAG: AMP-binding protein [Nitrospirae bacterium]|nr:AMP-binding protein [Nitrospirota bacterium]
MTETIIDLFGKAASTYPDNAALHYYQEGWQTVTYRELAGRVTNLATHLITSGVKKNDRIAIISENRPEWSTAYLAILSSGCIAVPLDAQLGPEEVKTLLIDSEAGIILHSNKTAGQLGFFAEHFRKAAGRDPLLIDFDSTEYRAIEKRAQTEALPTSEQDDIASIIYTSGTTGNPKGVVLTHKNFCSDARALIDAHIVSHEDNVLSILPLHHTYAFMCTFMVPLFLGASITYPLSMKGPDMIAAIQEKGVSIVIGVPQLLSMIRNNIMARIKALSRPLPFSLTKLIALSGMIRGRLGFNLGRLIFRSVHRSFGPRFRFFGSGGARLDPDVMEGLEALGFTVLEGYGLTETSPVVTFNPPEKRKPGSAGKPLPSVLIRIAHPSGAGEGEIEIKGPMVMKGYYNRPSATAEVMHDGWFRTGDIGRLDQEGYLFITGRSKEVIVLSSGKNIYPEDVEKMYLSSNLIREICITGVEHQGITESLHAVIVPDFEYAKQTFISNLYDAVKWEINALSGRLPSYMRIQGFTLQKDPLPRTPLGKLRRFMIKAGQPQQEDEKQEIAADRESLFNDEIGSKVLIAVGDLSKKDQEIRADDNLELDLGLDSLSRIELAVALETALSLKLSEDFMSDIHTVRELVEKIRRSSAGPQTAGPEKTGWKEIISAEPQEQIMLEKPELMMLPSRIVYAVMKLLAKLLFHLEARGLENISASGNFIIAPNHASYLDGFVVVLSLPFTVFRNLYLLGISDFFTGRLKGWFAKKAHVIPIDSSAYLNRALQTSAYVLRHGRSLCVFPEGGRSADNTLLEFKKGVGILAIEMGIPVVPVYIKGAFEALPREAAWPKFKKITVTYGTPLAAKQIDFSKKPADMDDYQYFAYLIRERVRELSRSA